MTTPQLDRRNPESMLPLTPAVFHILLALAGGERHGYGIMQEILAQTDGKMRIGPTTLYRSIKRMLADGLIVETDERPDPELDDERRRYYKLTMLGQHVALAESQRMEQTLRVAHARLGGVMNSSPTFTRVAGVVTGAMNCTPTAQGEGA
jgi:DNA-binding PadR family transcriptional regulator